LSVAKLEFGFQVVGTGKSLHSNLVVHG
jgi:hypothetical protein